MNAQTEVGPVPEVASIRYTDASLRRYRPQAGDTHNWGELVFHRRVPMPHRGDIVELRTPTRTCLLRVVHYIASRRRFRGVSWQARFLVEVLQ